MRTLHISVRFFTSLREIVGSKEEAIEFKPEEQANVGAVLKRLAERHGKEFVNYVYDTKTGEVKGFLQLLVNGRSVSSEKGLETELEDGDVLAIIPPVGGG